MQVHVALNNLSRLEAGLVRHQLDAHEAAVEGFVYELGLILTHIPSLISLLLVISV